MPSCRARRRMSLDGDTEPVKIRGHARTPRQEVHVEELELRRQKHLSSLERLEADAKRLQTLETLLRRIVNRLCLAATGRDPELNKELTRLSSAMSRKADVSELAPMLIQLSSAIAARDKRPEIASPSTIILTTPASQRAIAATRAASGAVVESKVASPSPVANVVAGEASTTTAPSASTPSVAVASAPTSSARIHSLLVELIERLTVLPDAQSTIQPLKAQVHAANSDAELIAVVQRVAELINEQQSRVVRERDELQRMLQQITQHLEQVASYINGEAVEQQVAVDSSQDFNNKLLGEVSELGTNVEQASDLSALQLKARGSLAAISGHLREFRAREEMRVTAYRERAEGMRQRVEELESQSRALQESLEREQRLALIDTLTGIPNRLSFTERVTQEFKRWNRFHEPFSVAVWDIDHFKAINDSYGHPAGDKVLRIIAQQLAGNVRETDFVARYGGEEFVMVLLGAPVDEAFALVDSLRNKVSELGFHFDRKRITVTVSCGIAPVQADDSLEKVMERADKALYQAKEQGRNRCALG
ncbi:MAG: diguanylate cyclase [bacterium]